MAHFAEIDNEGIVKKVLVVSNDLEHRGADFLANDLGLGGSWVQTSYNNNFRKQFASEGCIYDSENDVFILPQPYPSWSLDDNFDWQSPTPKPTDNEYVWDEDNLTWIKVPQNFTSWSGLENPTSPSILMDTAPRSAGRFLNQILHTAYPSAYIKWGYSMPHNPTSFDKAVGVFDVVITTVRNPLDSLASNIVTFNVTDESDIVKEIQATTNILKAILANKSNITVFKFEDVTNDTANVLSDIGLLLGVTPEPFDEVAIKESLKIEGANFYSVPKDNQSELDAAKAILNQPQFGVYMGEAFMAYEGIIA
jgi:hypothetical protein